MTGLRHALVLLLAVTATACGRAQTARTTPAPAPPPVGEQSLRAIPLGAPPGEPVSPAVAVANPHEGDAAAIAEGKALFGQMNCVYCHGAEGSGLIGPPLNGRGWRYGGAPAQLFNSIHDGRPGGMPAWGERLPPDHIWKLVAYLESLGGAEAPASADMAKLGGAQPSTTGDQPADQVQADTAQQSRSAANGRSGE
jgi:cytochrome c oxidase cbb3-type subunit 3